MVWATNKTESSLKYARETNFPTAFLFPVYRHQNIPSLKRPDALLLVSG